MDTNINSGTICVSLGYASNFSVAATVKISAFQRMEMTSFRISSGYFGGFWLPETSIMLYELYGVILRFVCFVLKRVPSCFSCFRGREEIVTGFITLFPKRDVEAPAFQKQSICSSATTLITANSLELICKISACVARINTHFQLIWTQLQTLCDCTCA